MSLASHNAKATINGRIRGNSAFSTRTCQGYLWVENCVHADRIVRTVLGWFFASSLLLFYFFFLSNVFSQSLVFCSHLAEKKTRTETIETNGISHVWKIDFFYCFFCCFFLCYYLHSLLYYHYYYYRSPMWVDDGLLGFSASLTAGKWSIMNMM